jgi:hypothetical protein
MGTGLTHVEDRDGSEDGHEQRDECDQPPADTAKLFVGDYADEEGLRPCISFVLAEIHVAPRISMVNAQDTFEDHKKERRHLLGPQS